MSARALPGRPDDGAVCRGHVRAVILCKARRLGYWLVTEAKCCSVFLSFLLLRYSTALLFVFLTVSLFERSADLSHCLRLYFLDFGNYSWTGRVRIAKKRRNVLAQKVEW